MINGKFVLFCSVVALIGLWLQCGFFRMFIREEEFPKKKRRSYVFWGMFGATLLSGLLQYLYKSPGKVGNDLAIVIAPVTEEFFKGLPVLFACLAGTMKGRRNFLVAGALSGAGFHFFELLGYSLGADSAKGFATQIVFRMLINSFNHCFYSGFFGLGAGFASMTKSRLLKALYLIAGFSLAVCTHAFHNTLAQILSSGRGNNQAIGVVVVFSISLAFIYVLLLVLSIWRKSRQAAPNN